MAIPLRFFDAILVKPVTRFIDLPTANDGTAAAIFEKVDSYLSSCQVTYDMICFNSDTCNTMKGQHKGVVKHLRDHQPALIDYGCICHLESLAIKAACKTLPIKVESLLVDLNTHFCLSMKKNEEFKSFCAFVDVTNKKILTHVETRWLSQLRIIVRVLELWPALVSYFTTTRKQRNVGERRSSRTNYMTKQCCTCSFWLSCCPPSILSMLPFKQPRIRQFIFFIQK